jgi:SdrD B-like domain/Secretion system C-terminal sorting domain
MVTKQMLVLNMKLGDGKFKSVSIISLMVLLLIAINSNAGISTREKNKPNFSTGSIGNFVWFDRDRDGRQDSGEPGLSGIVVVLNDSGGMPLLTTLTDSLGNYLFTGLDAGLSGRVYQVLFKLPAGFIFSPKTAPIIPNDVNSDADEQSGKTGFFTIMPGQVNKDIDAGMISTLNGTLPLHTLELTAVLQETKVSLRWVAENEMNTNKFVIQRSFDGANYSDIGTQVVTGQINIPTAYGFVTDIQNLSMHSIIYYRIKAEDNIQRFAYSNIASVRLSKVTGIRVWPNPFINDISISYNGVANGKADASITDNSGKVVWKNVFDISRGINQLSIKGLQRLQSGYYIINITDRGTNQSFVQKLTK